MFQGAAGHFITDFGNPVVALSAACVLLIVLFRTDHSRVAITWLTAIAGLFVSAAILKLVSREFGDSFVGTPFHLSVGAPSGHTSLSMIVYGGAAVILHYGSGRLGRSVSHLIFFLLLLGISITRVTLKTHTGMDVLTGLVLGAIFVIPVAIASSREEWADRKLNAALVFLLIFAATLIANVSGIRITSAVMF